MPSPCARPGSGSDCGSASAPWPATPSRASSSAEPACPRASAGFPFDQIDFIVGALVLVWPVADLSWLDAVAILLVSALGHILVNHIGYWLGVRPARW